MSSRLPDSHASAVGSRAEITIRHMLPTDDSSLRRLAELAGVRGPAGWSLVAEADGDLVAAVTTDGAVVDDPFRVTTDITELLRLRSAQLRAVAA